MVEETNQRLEAVERAARKLRAAKHTGEPGDHLEMLYDEVARAFDAILAKHPQHSFSSAQREAIGEIVCMAVLANAHADKPAHVRFLSKLWNDFSHKSPSDKIKTAFGIIAFFAVLAGTTSVAWHQTPGALRLAASIVESWNGGSEAHEASGSPTGAAATPTTEARPIPPPADNETPDTQDRSN